MIRKEQLVETQKKRRLRMFAIAMSTLVLILVLGLTMPALSRATLFVLAVATRTPTPVAGDIIPLKPITDLTSLNATVKLNVNGIINGKRTQGDLNADLTTNDQGKSKVTLTGSLLGELATQVGGTIVGLFTPSSVDIYKVPQGLYIVLNSIYPVCVKPDNVDATAALDDVSPKSLMSMLTSSDVARGKLVGTERLNGRSVKHYVIYGDAFIAAAQKSDDPKLKAFGDALWSAEDADLYVDAKDGYPVAFHGSYSGAYEPLKFQGDFDVNIELTDVNTNTSIDLPSSCRRPITP